MMVSMQTWSELLAFSISRLVGSLTRYVLEKRVLKVSVKFWYHEELIWVSKAFPMGSNSFGLWSLTLTKSPTYSNHSLTFGLWMTFIVVKCLNLKKKKKRKWMHAHCTYISTETNCVFIMGRYWILEVLTFQLRRYFYEYYSDGSYYSYWVYKLGLTHRGLANFFGNEKTERRHRENGLTSGNEESSTCGRLSKWYIREALNDEGASHNIHRRR